MLSHEPGTDSHCSGPQLVCMMPLLPPTVGTEEREGGGERRGRGGRREGREEEKGNKVKETAIFASKCPPTPNLVR